MDAPTQILFTQLVDNAREEHPLETDLVNLLMESRAELCLPIMAANRGGRR